MDTIKLFNTNIALLDLTHTVISTIPTYEGTCGFEQTITWDYDKWQSPKLHTAFRVQKVTMRAGIGTHIDAPAHCFPDTTDIAQLALENLLVPTYVINVTSKAHAAYTITTEDIHTFEKEYGPIRAKSLVIFYTGWDRFWDNPLLYRNQDENGIMRFPKVSQEAAQLLLERNIVGIAIDTLSPDGDDHEFPVHNILLKQGKYIIENIASASKLNPTNNFVIALPLKIAGGTESALRVVALIER